MAISYLEQSVAKYPLYGLSHYNLAISYQKANRPDLCLKHHYLALQTATEDEKEVIATSQDIIETVEKSLLNGFSIEDYFADADRFERAFELMVEQEHEQAAELFEVVASN